MKLFKLATILFFLGTISLVTATNFHSKENFSPIAQQTSFYQKLDLALKTSNMETSSIEIRDFNHQVEFYIQSQNEPIKIILSDQKDPFWQISSLQQLLKTVKMNQQPLKLVDLSAAQPYATFKNN